MKLHKEKNDSDTSQVILDRNQKPVPPVPYPSDSQKQNLTNMPRSTRKMNTEPLFTLITKTLMIQYYFGLMTIWEKEN
jgi:hypothetical protein